MNSAEDQREKAAEIPTTTPTHLFEKAADSEPPVDSNAGPEQANSASTINVPSSPKQREQTGAGLLSVSGRVACSGSSRSSPVAEAAPIKDVSSLQWIQALELQVVGACRSDERLRPSLRWNVSCFGSDGRLLAHLGQHFKARELALLARCLCTPMVSLRVGKVSRQGRFLYPTSARGYLNLMLLPCSEMRLAFADDMGTVEQVAVTIPGLESGGILIEELKEDASRRTFVLKDRNGKITNYFWQSEKLKSTGDELIVKMRNTLKRQPTLAHLSGIEEGRLDSFADYLRTVFFSKPSSPSPTQNLQASSSSPEPEPEPHPSKAPKLSTCSQDHASRRFESSMEKLHRCMQEIDASLRPDSPLRALARTLPGTAQLIESLERLRKCLQSLSSTRSNSIVPARSYRFKAPPFENSRPQQEPSRGNDFALTVCTRRFNPGPATLADVVDRRDYPSTTKPFEFHQPLVLRNSGSFFGECFTQVVVPNEMVRTHNLYVLPSAYLEHVGDKYSPPHRRAFWDRRRRANRFTAVEYCGVRRPLLWTPWNHAENGVIASDPNARSGAGRRRRRRRLEDDREIRKKGGACRACPRCVAGAGLGNLVLLHFYAHETGPGFRVVTAEITSGNASYIVRFSQSF